MERLTQLRELIEMLEEQRDALGDSWSALVSPLIKELSKLEEENATGTPVGLVATVLGNGRVTAGRDIVGRDQIINFYGHGVVSEEEEAEVVGSYLKRLFRACNILDLRAIDPRAIDPKQEPMALSDVYVFLNTTSKVAYGVDKYGGEHRLRREQLSTTTIECIGGWEMVPMTAIEAADAHKRLILLGDPGSGKSSFINFLALCLAGQAIDVDPASEWSKYLASNGWTQSRLLPIKVNLQEFAVSADFGMTSGHICAFMVKSLGVLKAAERPIKRALRRGSALVMFDGLDELELEVQSKAIHAILDVSATFPDSRYLVTCRLLDYNALRERAMDLSEFATTTIAPLNREQVEIFTSSWYRAVRRHGWRIDRDAEAQFLSALHRPDLAALSRNPLLLTQMVLLHSSYGQLPMDRVELYDEVVELLLTRWEERKGESLIQSLNLPGLRLTNLKSALCDIAFHAQSMPSRRTVGIPRAQILDIMQSYLGGDWGKAQRFCEFVEKRTGLLRQQEKGSFAFPHSTFQEFLSAKYLAEQENFAATAADLVREDPIIWKEVYPMAIRVAGADRGVMAITSLCYKDAPDEVQSTADTDWYAAWIAGSALVEVGLLEVKRRPERVAILKRVADWLASLLNTGALSVKERAEAGKVLAQLGDPRPGVCTRKPDFVLIPSGPFVMSRPGSTSKLADDGWEDQLNIPYDYWIARYPVTQAQYTYFVSENPEIQVPGGVEGYEWDSNTRTPPSERLNHPVVLVSWHDARKYCRWLDERLRTEGVVPDGYEVRLPTEAEWTKAQRGGIVLLDGSPNPMVDRLFPWGRDWEENRANTPDAEVELAETSAVGMFPTGASVYGILELSGNVAEWTRTSWGGYDVDKPGYDYPYDPTDGREEVSAEGFRVLRGGSWLFSEGAAKCACRLDPTSRYPDTGFRVIIGPKGYHLKNMTYN
jgi:formylglycine-generating enzyme required for sulfatase activity